MQSSNQSEQLDILIEDIEFLVRTMFPKGRLVSRSDVRMASVILRRWIVDGDLNNINKSDKTVFSFFAIDNSDVLAAIALNDNIEYFCTGGVKFDGVPVQGVYKSKSESPKIRPEIPVDKMNCRDFLFRDFRKQNRIFCNGRFFSLIDIISFVSNKTGGAHYDANRDKVQDAEIAYRSCTFGGGFPNPDFTPIGAIHLELEPNDESVLSAFDVEIIAASASFAQMRVDGNPIIKLNFQKSFTSRLRDRLNIRKRLKTAIYQKI